MKKLFLSTILSVLVAASSFAADINKNAEAVYSFNSQFERAENVSWTSTKGFAKASFTLNNKQMAAFYQPDGSLIGTTSAVTLEELPVIAKRSFAKKYSDYTVKEAIRFDATDETAYFISAEDEARSLILKVSAEGMVSVYKSVKK
jgi:hypothetical protein